MASNLAEVYNSLTDVDEALPVMYALLLHIQEAPTSFDQLRQLNFVMIGKTGDGKSATGNSALGRQEFKSSQSASSVTSEVTCSQGVYGNYFINIVDTPGLADTQFCDDKVKAAEQIIDNMEKAINMSPGGVHAFLYVVQFCNGLTDKDKRALETLRQILGRTFLETNGIILFTHGDCFQHSLGMKNTPYKSFDEWYKEQRGTMRDLIKECNNKCILFNNRLRDSGAIRKQVEQLVGLAERYDDSYALVHFMLAKPLRNKLIIELKLPKLKQTFQREIDQLNSVISRDVRFGRATPDDVNLITLKIQQLLRKIILEDKGTELLIDMLWKVRDTHLVFTGYIKNYEEARRRREDDSSPCSIM